MQGINGVNRENVTSVRQQDIPIDIVNSVLVYTFNTWTSGNKIIDDFIHKCQILSSLPTHILEWIPFDQFKNVKKLTEGGFSSIYTAIWTRGTIVDYDENRREFTYFGPERVVLKSLNNSNNAGKAFFNEVIN